MRKFHHARMLLALLATTVSLREASASQYRRKQMGAALLVETSQDCAMDPPRVEIDWSGRSSGRGLAAGEPVRSRTLGCLHDARDVVWRSEGGQVYGAGTKVNAISDASSLTLTACATSAQGVQQCASATVRVGPRRPSLRTEVVVTPVPGGRMVTVTGHADNVVGAMDVAVFAHTDVFYRAPAPVTLDPTGLFTTTLWVAPNVDRLNFVLVPRGQDVGSLPGCTLEYCEGELDLTTHREVPLAVDDTVAYAETAHYFSAPIVEPVSALMGAFEGSPVTGKLQPANLMRSGRDRDLAYTYDQGLAAVALSLAGKKSSAQRVLNALVNLQNLDGSWYFGYALEGEHPFPVQGDARYAGAVAWVLLGMNAYHHAFRSNEFRAPLEKGLTYLRNQMIAVGDGRAVRFNPSDLGGTAWDETKLTAVEHNLEALAAFEGYRTRFGGTQYAAAVKQVRAFLDGRWAGDHFRPGNYAPVGDETEELYLDTQYYGVLAFGSRGPYGAGLRYNCASFESRANYLSSDALGLKGFTDFRGASGATDNAYVWSEGTLGMVTAMNIARSVDQCPTIDGTSVLRDMGALVSEPERRGYPEATLSDASPFSSTSSLAATAWYAIALSGKNPLRPWE